jgi:hypothetical protein
MSACSVTPPPPITDVRVRQATRVGTQSQTQAVTSPISEGSDPATNGFQSRETSEDDTNFLRYCNHSFNFNGTGHCGIEFSPIRDPPF